MKIAIIGYKSFDSLEFHLQDELAFQGHDAKIFDYYTFFPFKIDMGFSLISESYVEYKNKKLEKIVFSLITTGVLVLIYYTIKNAESRKKK